MKIDYLLDTTIVIDFLRDHTPAVTWLRQNGAATLALAGFVALEVLQGARNKSELLLLRKELQKFPLCWPSDEDCNQALATYSTLYLSHGVSILDALIAHTAIGTDACLLTLNEKHFKPISSLRFQKPY